MKLPQSFGERIELVRNMKIAAFVAWVVAVAPATLQPLAWRDNKLRKKQVSRARETKHQTTEVTHPHPQNEDLHINDQSICDFGFIFLQPYKYMYFCAYFQTEA